METTFDQRLQIVIEKLKAPKGQYNSFGKYNYRNCEDILEAVKPLMKEQNLRMKISDEVVQVGTHNYVKATVMVTDGEKSDFVSAYAREAIEQKGMQDSQITGSTSSYARKYALNGMFCIDDTKDADTNEQREQSDNAPKYALTGAPLLKIKGLLNILDVYDDKRESILEQVTSEAKANELTKQLEAKVAAKKEPRVEPI